MAARLLTIDDLVDAYLEAHRWKDAVAPLRDYHATRRDLLEAMFGVSLDDVPDTRREERDRAKVASTAIRCVHAASALHLPFGYYVEGGPGPLEGGLLARHRARIEVSQEGLRAGYRAVVRDALETLFPQATLRVFDEDDLFAAGLPREAPDPDDFW